MKLLLWPALLALTLPGSGLAATVEDHAKAVLAFGPRVAGSAANGQARSYLEEQFRALGYQTRREAFSYPRFDDLGSDVRVGEQVLGGNALQDSAGGEVTAPAVRVPGVGTSADFARVDVRGRVAVVQRGQIPFIDKARAALAAGAVGVIIVNNSAGDLRGTLGQALNLPVLGVSTTVGAALKDNQPVTLRVRVRQGEVQAVNLIAFKAGVDRPEVLFGAHLDSVQGAPGANDNLSGSLAVLEIARQAANTSLSARSFFVLFDGEEDGLLGSRAFVKDNPSVTGGLKAMLNLDMVGVNVMPLSISGEAPLVEAARRAGVEASVGTPGSSDQVPFRQAGVPTLFFHRGLDANYHQPGDTLLDSELVRQAATAAFTITNGVLSAVPAN
ncbi:M28 family metallopeptidase [Deinococcus humi]|uniref:Zn-dependent M28 family amino/carboxypeptidase n=1 Tax=Deinococcus humi TaxID=662880 RepID=A0A7W8JR13_9DEIO|nr:M28 family metallopeptidase [Deinococcus humi]MBB5361626.1 Zn-dependent M28 family amino/carboxypeptidase [Deinococcus humi]GGO21008.1 aminopeptidase [Deinococcus humi]